MISSRKDTMERVEPQQMTMKAPVKVVRDRTELVLRRVARPGLKESNTFDIEMHLCGIVTL